MMLACHDSSDYFFREKDPGVVSEGLMSVVSADIATSNPKKPAQVKPMALNSTGLNSYALENISPTSSHSLAQLTTWT